MSVSRTFAGVLLVGAVLSIAVGGARSQGGDNRPMTNIKFYKGLNRQQVVAIMKGFNRDLGVKCSHCHMKDFSSDEKPEKKTAREMIHMLAEMNAKYPLLEKKGTCFMCHRGAKDPVFEPAAAGQ